MLDFDIYKFYAEISEKNIAIRLDAGEPDIAPHPELIEFMKRHSSELGYAPPAGIRELREKIAEEHRVDLGEVAVVPGSKAGIAAVVARASALGVIAPYWPGYVKAACTFGKEVVVVHTSLRDKWIPRIASLEAVADTIDTLIVNYPNNPTGAVLDRATVRGIVDLAEDRELVLVSDEAYRDIVFGEEQPPIASLRVENTVSVYSFSKTFSLPGLRIGYVVGDKSIIEKIVDFTASTYTSVPIFAQKVAIKALELRREVVDYVRKVYRERLEVFEKHIDREIFRFARPRGAFYVFLEMSSSVDSIEVARRLADRGVGVFPGVAFGRRYYNYLRVSLTKPPSLIQKALSIIREVVIG